MKPNSSHIIRNVWRALTVLFMVFALALTWAMPTPSLAADPIGTVTKKRMDVYGTPPDSARERIYPRSDVVYGELIETAGGGAVLIQMEDASELYLGERASLTLDDFVYNPKSCKGKAVYNFSVGTLRYVSGDMEETEISILTPNANIGVRGSEAIIFVTPEGETFVNVFEGVFSVSSRDRPDVPAVDVEAGKNVSLTGATGFSQVGVGVKVPSYKAPPGVKVPNFNQDLMGLKDGGTFDKDRGGGTSGGDGGSSSGGSGGGEC